MSTAESLETITDRGKFECLANAVLSKDNRDYAAIIALGVNAQGETIRGPFDGFCQVPGSEPPHFVWVQHTTEDRQRLRDKWLSENEESLGDLLKVGRAARNLRIDFPTAKFTVILSTNQRMPSESLETDVYKKAEELGVRADIWEQSRCARFLDSNRDGQYLRKTFLGTDAEMLSAELLAELGKKSLEIYKKEQFTSPETWVSRGLDDILTGRLDDLSCRIKLLVGESGFGKSAATYRFLEKHIGLGEFGLYIPANIVQTSVSLDDALGQMLHRLYPTLLSKEASLIPQFMSSSSQFVIAVDDVNQTNNPLGLVRNLASWVEPPYLVVCPVWPRFWNQMREREHKPGVDVIAVDQMAVEEARNAIETVASVAGLGISNIEAYGIAARLGYDPLLIGTFSDLLKQAGEEEINGLAEDAIAISIAKRISEATAASGNKFFEHEYRDALFELASRMLKQKQLYPKWDEVERWLQDSPKRLAALRDLCTCENLCHVSTDGTFGFRHDRFLEYFCVQSMIKFLEDPRTNADVLQEPYYAEWVGEALVLSPQENAILDSVLNGLPLALVSAIHYIGTPTTDYHLATVSKVKEWVAAYAGPYNSSTPESVRAAVAISFLYTDSPAVLEIVNTSFGLDKRWLGDFARFRNGDANGAIWYCSVFGLRGGDDAFLFTELVRHTKLHHRTQLAQDLRHILKSPETKQVHGALVLAGYLGLPELQDAIPGWWKQVVDKTNYLAETIWAALRCSNSLVEDEFVRSLFTHWSDLPGVEESQRFDRQKSVTEQLAPALSYHASKEIVDYLISQSNVHESLRLPIAHICGRIDLPDSIEFAIRVCADSKQERCSVTDWGSLIFPRLSASLTTRLRGLWSNQENSDSVRRLAFQLWARNANRDQADFLRTIATATPAEPFFKDAVWERARLGDTACVPDLIQILETDTAFFRVAHHVWCGEVMCVAGRRLEAFRENIPQDFSGGELDQHYHLAEMLKGIPVEDAESLLLKHWEHLRHSRLFVQAALFVGTPQCLALAETTISECPDSVNLFEYIDQFFGVSRFGLGLSVETAAPVLTLQHIKSLEPYLSRLDEMALHSFASVCYRLGKEGIEWCEGHFPDAVNEACRKRYCPTDEDLIQMLDVYSQQHPNMISHWLEGFEKRSDLRNPIEILRRWLESDPTFRKVQAAAWCIEQIGSREDLKMLDVSLQYPIEQQMANLIRESTTFAVRRRTLQ